MRSWCRLLIAIPLLGFDLLLSSGCRSDVEIELQRKITSLTEQIEEKDNQLVAQRLTVEQLHQQLDTARGFTKQDLEKIFHPEKIEIVSLSGGDDYDGKPGDDGITIYLRPIDRDGDALKVAGNIRIELYDLENPSGQKLIGEYFIPADQVAEHWYGKLATYHYTIRCPWQQGPPSHNEITIRATFEDFLSQRVMTAQAVRTVKPAP